MTLISEGQSNPLSSYKAETEQRYDTPNRISTSHCDSILSTTDLHFYTRVIHLYKHHFALMVHSGPAMVQSDRDRLARSGLSSHPVHRIRF